MSCIFASAISLLIGFIIGRLMFLLKKDGSIIINNKNLEMLAIDIPIDLINKRKRLIIQVVHNTSHIIGQK